MAKNQDNDQKINLEDGNLSFDEDKQSFELDVNENLGEYDHPSDYETVANGAVDDDSTYDNSNPFVGDEYASAKAIGQDELVDLGMHIDKGQSVKLSPEDEFLARTKEDERDDLDEEGYPVNDIPIK